MLAIVARARKPSEWAGPAMLLLAFSGLPVFWALRAWYQLRKLRTMPAVKVNPTEMDFVPDISTLTATFKKKRYAELVVLTRPRRLKMTWRGRLYLSFAVVAVTPLTYFGIPALWREFTRGRIANEWGLVLWLAMIYGYLFVFFRNRLRERRLLANGELATGYIVKQTNGRYTQSVEYRFEDVTGSSISGRCTDPSRSLYEGMFTPVFYDASNPKCNVSLDCSLTKIGEL